MTLLVSWTMTASYFYLSYPPISKSSKLLKVIILVAVKWACIGKTFYWKADEFGSLLEELDLFFR